MRNLARAWHHFWWQYGSVERSAWIAWALLLAAVGIRVAVSRATSQTVVPIYLVAGERWLGRADLYSPIPAMDLYRNPPLVALAFAPLTVMPSQAAGLVVRGLSVALFLLGLWRVRGTLPAGWLFLLAVWPVIPSVNNGQLNILIAAAGLNAVAALDRGRTSEAALWLGLAGWVKLYPFALGLLACVVQPLKLPPRLAAFTLLGFALPFAFAPTGYVWEQYAEYLTYLGGDDRTYAHTLERVPRDWTCWPRMFLNEVIPAATARAVSLAVAGLAAALVAWRAWRGTRAVANRLALTLGSVWMTAFGPATEMNTYTLLGGVAALVTVAAARPASIFAAAGYALLVATVARGAWRNDYAFHVYGPQALGAVLLGVAACLTPDPGEERRNP